VGAGGASGISGSQWSGFRRRPSDVLDDAVVALGAAVDLREQPPVRAGSVSNRSTQIFTWSMAGSPTDPSAAGLVGSSTRHGGAPSSSIWSAYTANVSCAVFHAQIGART